MAQTRSASWFDRVDRAVTGFMADTGVTLLRVSIGIIYIWFGALKVVGISPAAPLISASWGFVPMPIDWFVRVIGVLEVLIGLGFISKIAMRAVIALMLMQMLGAFSPLILSPDRLFTAFPYGLTLEGQYVIKDIVFVSAALVIGATVRGGGLTDNPAVRAIDLALEAAEEPTDAVQRKVA